MQSKSPTWKEVVAEALRGLGGQGHLSEINERVRGHPKTAANPTWRDTIRRVVRQYKIFQPVPPARSGVYRLVEVETPEPQAQNLDSTDAAINHDAAQGMLVTLGKIYGYETFVPVRDQKTRLFQGTRLADLVTVRDCTDIFRGPNLPKIREIDVLWFDEDDYGLFPAYAFEVEHTTKIRDGMDRLLKIPRRFPVRLFLIAPTAEEQALFDRLVNQTPFRAYRDRFVFRLYSQLQAVYNACIRHKSAREVFGVNERYRRA